VVRKALCGRWKVLCVEKGSVRPGRLCVARKGLCNLEGSVWQEGSV
jgi:hypothetical protein